MRFISWDTLFALSFCWTSYYCLSRAFRDQPRSKAEALKGLLAAVPPLSIVVLKIVLLLHPIHDL